MKTAIEILKRERHALLVQLNTMDNQIINRQSVCADYEQVKIISQRLLDINESVDVLEAERLKKMCEEGMK